MDQTVHNLTLDVSKNSNNLNETVKLRQGDKASHTIEARITNHGQAYNLSGLTAQLCVDKPDGTSYIANGNVRGNYVNHTINQNLSSASGKATGYFKIKDSSGNVIDSTGNFDLLILPALNVASDSVPYIQDAEELISYLRQHIDSANSSAQAKLNAMDKELSDFRRNYQAVLNDNRNLDMSRFETKANADLVRARVTQLENIQPKKFNSDSDAINWSRNNHTFAYTDD